MRVFIAGATGVIGRYAIPALIEAGHEVTGITRSAERAKAIAAAGATACIGDVYNRAELTAAMSAAKPEVVFHLLTDLAGRDFAANSRIRLEGTRNLVDAAKAAGARRMISESLAWVYAPAEGPATEDQPLDLEAGGQRAAGLQPIVALEEQSGEMPECVILRYGALYGPGTWYARDGGVGDQARAGKLTANDAVTSFVHVEDSGRATAAALEWPVGIYNVVDDEPAAGKTWAPIFAKAVGGQAPVLADGREPWQRGASNDKARAMGWTLRYPTWRQGFAQGLG